MDWNKLTKPFNDEDVFWRIDRSFGQWARVLCYLDARAVMDRLDAAVGPGNWQDKYFETPNGKNMCELSIKVDGEWVTKSDGAGNTNIEGDKGGISDAFKRAAVKWGIGRHLYSLGETKVNLSGERPSVPKHYLVVCSKRGQQTTYGVAPSLREIQRDLFTKHDPKERRLNRIREALKNNNVGSESIPLVLEAGTAKRRDTRWIEKGKTNVNPRSMGDAALKILSHTLKKWDDDGDFASNVLSYKMWSVKGEE
jgi:hypothetical protein